MGDANPLVSIACITYNQEKYIAQTIEGFLLQEVGFSIEIIIHDDASTDRTATIIQEYATKYPHLIFPIIQTENKWSNGINPMSSYVFPRCRGKYVAICEGDDYWIDPTKLRRHADYLEAREEYSMVYSDIISIDENGHKRPITLFSRLGHLLRKKEGDLEKTLVKGNFIMTLTTLIRKSELLIAESIIHSYPKNISYIDYTLFLEISRLGKIHFDHQKTAAYRVLTESVSHSVDLDKRMEFIEKTSEISLFYNEKYSTGYSVSFLRRIRLGAQLKELASRKMYKKYFELFLIGIEEDWVNLFRLKHYLCLIVSFLGE
jgi:glycosyltransferase involved in cell wall biosynthesis